MRVEVAFLLQGVDDLLEIQFLVERARALLQIFDSKLAGRMDELMGNQPMIDRRRVDYVAHMLRQAGVKGDIAAARAQILYWAFLGYALSDQPLPQARQKAVIDELLAMATR